MQLKQILRNKNKESVNERKRNIGKYKIKDKTAQENERKKVVSRIQKKVRV